MIRVDVNGKVSILKVDFRKKVAIPYHFPQHIDAFHLEMQMFYKSIE